MGFKLVMIGPQGSGKGSQGELLSKYFKIPLIVTGDLYRAQIRLGTDIGKLAQERITKGLLMPDDITRELVQDELAIQQAQDGVILDGYPRNLEQAMDLDKMLDIDYVIYLDVPDEVTIQRISSRRVCPQGHVYNLVSHPPKKEGYCDFDGEALMIREDDKPEVIKKRLEIFHKETEPVLKHYQKQGKVLRFDARGKIEDINREIIKKLEALAG